MVPRLPPSYEKGVGKYIQGFAINVEGVTLEAANENQPEADSRTMHQIVFVCFFKTFMFETVKAYMLNTFKL